MVAGNSTVVPFRYLRLVYRKIITAVAPIITPMTSIPLTRLSDPHCIGPTNNISAIVTSPVVMLPPPRYHAANPTAIIRISNTMKDRGIGARGILYFVVIFSISPPLCLLNN